MKQDIQLRQPLRDLKVAITGGTSGLGLALLRQFADAGASVAFVARDAARLAPHRRQPSRHPWLSRRCG